MPRIVIAVMLICAFTWSGCDSGTSDNAAGMDSTAGEVSGEAPKDLPETPEVGDTLPEEDLFTPGEDLFTPEEDLFTPEEDLWEIAEAVQQPPEEVVQPVEALQPEEELAVGEEIPVSAGACDNEEDFQILQAVEATLSDTIAGCAMKCIGQGVPCMAGCVQEGTGLSTDCSNCFGAVIDCTISKCMFQCMDSSSAACAECQELHCADAFMECAGISMDQ